MTTADSPYDDGYPLTQEAQAQRALDLDKRLKAVAAGAPSPKRSDRIARAAEDIVRSGAARKMGATGKWFLDGAETVIREMEEGL